jgi:heme A synthase
MRGFTARYSRHDANDRADRARRRARPPRRHHRKSWVDAHGLTGDILQVIALITMIYAIARLRKSAPVLMWSSVVLFVLVVVQAGLGHSITDNSHDGLLVIHVPLALIIFGTTIWQSITASRLRRDPTRV